MNFSLVVKSPSMHSEILFQFVTFSFLQEFDNDQNQKVDEKKRICSS